MGTLAPLPAPAPLTRLKFNLICNLFPFHNCYMDFSWLCVLLRDKNDFSDFCPDLVFASSCMCYLQEPSGMFVARSQESAGVTYAPSSWACAFGELICRRPACPVWPVGRVRASSGTRVPIPALPFDSLSAEDLFCPAVLWGGGKLVSSSSGIFLGLWKP